MTTTSLLAATVATALLLSTPVLAQVAPTPQGTPVPPNAAAAIAQQQQGQPPGQPEVDVKLQGVIASFQAATSSLQILLAEYDQMKLRERSISQRTTMIQQQLTAAEARLAWFDAYFRGLQSPPPKPEAAPVAAPAPKPEELHPPVR